MPLNSIWNSKFQKSQEKKTNDQKVPQTNLLTHAQSKLWQCRKNMEVKTEYYIYVDYDKGEDHDSQSISIFFDAHLWNVD